MHAGHDVPDIFFARIRSAGGPYRVDDGIAIAYSSAPTIGRLVALEGAVRTRCAEYERTAIPEIVCAIVEHPTAPYVAGETLTLYFVDPAIARIQRDASRPHRNAGAAESFDLSPVVDEPPGDDAIAPETAANSVSYLADELRRPPAQLHSGEPMTLRANDVTHARAPGDPDANEIAADERPHDALAGEPSTLERSRKPQTDLRAANEGADDLPESNGGIRVRLEWSAERVRRFIQVVDRLFTIDRLGWYRHSLAMRLLIPDDIRCGDELADVEAMRHLHALRAAAVSALGKPLLAACMPGFTVTSDWLETLESSREARAIAGLRDALEPYASDRAADTDDLIRTLDVASTVGSIGKRALLAENASSVESFLPILIPAVSHDAALSARLRDYRNLLVELFGQTARATDPVRLGALAQPNHSLDDRLWQLVGAVGEAFGGFVHT